MAARFRVPFRPVSVGFTLLELLVVLAVIGVLAAVLGPALSNAKAEAQRVRCINNLRQLGLALHLYSSDNAFHYPFWNGSTSPTPIYWHHLLEQYDPLAWTDAAAHCPAYRGIIDDGRVSASPRGSYAYNGLGTSGETFYTDPHNPRGLGWYPLVEAAVSEANVAVPTEMYALSDARVYLDPAKPGSTTWVGLTWMNIGFSNPGEVQPLRHGANYNVSFIDGHCSLVKRADYADATKTGGSWNRDHQAHLGEPP